MLLTKYITTTKALYLILYFRNNSSEKEKVLKKTEISLAFIVRCVLVLFQKVHQLIVVVNIQCLQRMPEI